MPLLDQLKSLGRKLRIIPSKTRVIFKPLAIVLTVIVVLAGAALATGFFWSQNFEGKIGPRVSISGVDVSGLYPELAAERLQRRVDQIFSEGLIVKMDGAEAVLNLTRIGDGDLSDDAIFDIQGAVNRALQLRHSSDPIVNLFLMAKGNIQPARLRMPVQIIKINVTKSLDRLFPEAKTQVQNARFSFKETGAGFELEIIKEQNGRDFDLESFWRDLSQVLENLETEPLSLQMLDVKPEIREKTAEAAGPTALAIVHRAPFDLIHEDERGVKKRWSLTAKQTADLLLPSGDINTPLKLDLEKLEEIMEPIAKVLDRKAQNARFRIEGNRVVEFAESKKGVTIDRDRMAKELLELMIGENQTLTIATKETEPEITTEQVNGLGIKEILGTGYSSYSGSPGKRILNIKNGVRLLDGLIIKPGEDFSLLGALRPFTLENGYLPELVIKGDKIEPEIGGGLCQIGTTTFRVAMNSGLPILERRNHSLVVSYYNDPENGNPGTDATIYDPAPDFRFINDTQHHILFQAEILEATRELRFTFWGTSDGRRGSYSPPVVLRWIGVGEPREVETTDLPPGARECQSAHAGASTQFTYTILRPNQEKEETVYSSYYRPLPKICLVGAQTKKIESNQSDNFSEFPDSYEPEE